jgi:hypothetical protein
MVLLIDDIDENIISTLLFDDTGRPPLQKPLGINGRFLSNLTIDIATVVFEGDRQ